jgi:hypothetical protein
MLGATLKEQVIVVETSAERQDRKLAGGQTSLTILQRQAQDVIAIEVCSVLKAVLRASVVSYNPRNLTSLVTIDGLQGCREAAA